MPDSNNWAFHESMESKKLRQSGTFRNCLSRKFDEVIVPIFAEILSVIDKNFNLDLIHNAPNQSSLLVKLWLGIFANKKFAILITMIWWLKTNRSTITGVESRV